MKINASATLRLLGAAALIRLATLAQIPSSAAAGASVAVRRQCPQPPTRDPHTAGYVEAKELPDGTNAPAPEMTVNPDVPHGMVYDFTMASTDSRIYPGIARDVFGTPDPDSPAKLDVPTSHPAPYTRRVSVYVPKQYVPGTAGPFAAGAAGPDRGLFTCLDNLIAAKRVP